MAFFDKLQDTANKAKDMALKAGEQISELAEEAVEVTKLSAKVLKEKSNIANFKKELGELVYSKYLEGEVDDCYKVICDNIKNSLEVIDVLNEEIEEVKKSKKNQNNQEEVYKEEQPIQTSEVQMKVCPLCNVKQPLDAKVCEVCGYEFEN